MKKSSLCWPLVRCFVLSLLPATVSPIRKYQERIQMPPFLRRIWMRKSRPPGTQSLPIFAIHIWKTVSSLNAISGQKRSLRFLRKSATELFTVAIIYEEFIIRATHLRLERMFKMWYNEESTEIDLPGLTLYYIEGKEGWTNPNRNSYSTATWIPAN